MILDLNRDLVATEEQLELDLENPYNYPEHNLPRTAIEIAINWEYSDILELLLDRGWDSNGVNARGDCPLLDVLKVLKSSLYDYYMGKDVHDFVQLLIKAEADPYPRGVALTPLQVAITTHDIVIIKQLLEAWRMSIR